MVFEIEVGITYNGFMDFESDFENVCGLVKIRLSPQEKKKLRPQLKRIVDWISELEKEEGISSLEPLHTPSRFTAPLRRDEIIESLPREDVLRQAPRTRRKMIEVPGAIKDR